MNYTTFVSQFSVAATMAFKTGGGQELEKLIEQPVECKFCNAVVRPVDGVGRSGGKMLFKCSRCQTVWVTLQEGRIDWH